MVPGSFLVLFVLMVVVLTAGQEAESETYYPRGQGRCRACAYDLAGLPPDRPCPECDISHPGATLMRTARRVVRPAVWRRMCLTLLLGVASWTAMLPVLHHVHLWSYRVQCGDREDVIAAALRVRGFDLEWQQAMLPMLAGTAACMLLCLGSDALRFARAATLVAAGAWVVSVAWLVVMTLVIYG